MKVLLGSRAVASITAMIAAVFMGSTLVTPIYPLYRQAFGFSEFTLTLIYAAYVLGNLGALLFLGRLSDQVGRRMVSLPAMGIVGVSTLVFLFAMSASWLYWARALSGVGVGLVSGTATAWLTDFYGDDGKSHATLAATSANFSGLAVGPLLAGPLAQYAPWPSHLSFPVYLLLLTATAILVASTTETVPNPVGSLERLSLRPRLGVPSQVRSQFMAPAITAFVTFAFVGFYAALLPGVMIREIHERNLAIAGGVVCELFAAATLALFATQKIRSRAAMLGGLLLLLPGLAALALAQNIRSLPVLIAGTALGGVAAALGYRGSLQVVNEIAPQDRRAEVVSSYFVACFSGNSIPVIGVGLLTELASPIVASTVFACIIAVCAGGAALIGMRYIPA